MCKLMFSYILGLGIFGISWGWNQKKISVSCMQEWGNVGVFEFRSVRI